MLLGILQLKNRELAVFTEDRRPVEHNLKPVRAGEFAGGGDENAGRTVWILHIGGHVVLHLNLMEVPLLAEGSHLGGHAANPLPQVKVMRALV